MDESRIVRAHLEGQAQLRETQAQLDVLARITQLETLIVAAVGVLCDPELDDAARCEQARELLSDGYE